MNGKRPRLILVAKHDIEPGTELLYDYGDRSKESLAVHPWLAKQIRLLQKERIHNYDSMDESVENFDSFGESDENK